MKKCQGITEHFWSNLSEDRRLAWKYSTRLVGLLLALLVTKTGNPYVDWCLPAATAIFLMIAIETQRSYSKLSPRLRKANIRLLVFLGSWAVAFLGIVYFSQSAFVASAQVFADQMRPLLKRDYPPLLTSIMLAVFAGAILIAVIRVLRQLNIEQLIYHLPRQGLINLFVKKPFRATSFGAFAYVELALLMVCLMYASAAAALIKCLIAIVNV
jgi:hypothetical protein